MCSELAVLRFYHDWATDPVAGVNVRLAAVPLDTANDPDDAAPPPVELFVEETTSPWAALKKIPDEIVDGYGRILVFNVITDTDFRARTEAASAGDIIQVAARVAVFSAREVDDTLIDTDRVLTELYRTLHVIREVISARFAALEAGTVDPRGYTRAGATLDTPPDFTRGEVAHDAPSPGITVGALLITQPVHFPWARAGL
jgi:hypothetical protein